MSLGDRRSLLRAGLGGALALGVAGSRAAAAQVPGIEADVVILRGLFASERRLASTHGYGSVAKALSGPVRELAGRLAGVEQAHADVFRGALGDRGSPIATTPLPASAIDGLERALRSDAAYLRFAVEVETTAAGALIDAVGRLADGALVERITQILVIEGAHLTELRNRADLRELPAAFAGATEA